MKEHRKEVGQQEGRKYQKHKETVTVGTEQIGNHRPRQRRKTHHQLGRCKNATVTARESDRTTRWIREAVDSLEEPRSYDQRRGRLPVGSRLRQFTAALADV